MSTGTALLIDGPRHNEAFQANFVGKDLRFLDDGQDTGRYVVDSFQSQLDGSTVIVYKWREQANS